MSRCEFTLIRGHRCNLFDNPPFPLPSQLSPAAQVLFEMCQVRRAQGAQGQSLRASLRSRRQLQRRTKVDVWASIYCQHFYATCLPTTSDYSTPLSLAPTHTHLRPRTPNHSNSRSLLPAYIPQIRTPRRPRHHGRRWHRQIDRSRWRHGVPSRRRDHPS